jgi:hypothetical protein
VVSWDLRQINFIIYASMPLSITEKSKKKNDLLPYFKKSLIIEMRVTITPGGSMYWLGLASSSGGPKHFHRSGLIMVALLVVFLFSKSPGTSQLMVPPPLAASGQTPATIPIPSAGKLPISRPYLQFFRDRE